MKKAVFSKILKNSGLIKEAGLNFSEPSKKDTDSFDLNFDDAGLDSSVQGDSTSKDKETHNSIKNDTGDDTSNGTPREKLHKLIEPQVKTANQIQVSINDAFKEIKTKRYNDILQQTKNFEKQLRGACSQIVSEVEKLNFDTTNSSECSPKAYKIIANYESRDRSSLDLIAAINVFYNSLHS